MAKNWQNVKKMAKFLEMAKKWQNFKKITHLINIYNNNNLINNILELY